MTDRPTCGSTVEGNALRLDKWFGEVMLIKHTILLPIRSSAAIDLEAREAVAAL